MKRKPEPKPGDRTDTELFARAIHQGMLACRRWQRSHPEAQLKFNPVRVRVPRGHREKMLLAGLDFAVAGGVAGNRQTRQLLMTLHRDNSLGGTSVAIAELAIQSVYGIKSALTTWEEV